MTESRSGANLSKANSYQYGGSHYQSSIQVWDFILANNVPYMEGQIIRYLTRWRKKNGLEDVYKAKHYLEKLIEYEEYKLTEDKCKEGDDHAFEVVPDYAGGLVCEKCGKHIEG